MEQRLDHEAGALNGPRQSHGQWAACASTAAVILAGGKGTRMGSDLPKVLLPLGGRPMIEYVVDVLEELGFGIAAPAPIIVIGFRGDDVMKAIGSKATYALQARQLGTGNAAGAALKQVGSEVDQILLIHGDEPMIGAETYRAMLGISTEPDMPIVLLTGRVTETQSLGRVIRDDAGTVSKLVQESELTSEQQYVNEINFGAYVFDRAFMEQALPRLAVHDGGEYYLTDLIGMAVEDGFAIKTVPVPHPDEQMGINTPVQLERATEFLRLKAS